MGQFVQGRKNGRLMSFFSASKTYEKQLRIEKTRLDWIGFTSGYRVATALRIVYWPTPFLTRLTASRSGWLFQLTIPPKVTIAEKA